MSIVLHVCFGYTFCFSTLSDWLKPRATLSANIQSSPAHIRFSTLFAPCVHSIRVLIISLDCLCLLANVITLLLRKTVESTNFYFELHFPSTSIRLIFVLIRYLSGERLPGVHAGILFHCLTPQSSRSTKGLFLY